MSAIMTLTSVTSVPKTTARQQSVIKTRLKLLTQNFFSAKSIYKCVMDDKSYFTVDGNEWQQQSSYESEDHPALEVVKCIRKTKRRFCCGWLSVKAAEAYQCFSKPVL
jgi:hypothetical protein